MEERIKSFMNCQQELEEKISIFKESFIKFYGEESKKEIEELFNKTIFIAYQDPDSLRFGIDKLLKDKSESLINRLLNTTKLTKKDLVDTYTLENYNIQPINIYKELHELYSLGEKGREDSFKEWSFKKLHEMIPELTKEEYEEMYHKKIILDKYQNLAYWKKGNIEYCIDEDNIKKNYQEKYKKVESLLKKYVPNITIDNFEEYFSNNFFQELDSLVEEYKRILQEYHSYKEELKPYQEEIDNNKRLSNEISDKYYKEYLLKNLSFFSPSEQQEIKDYVEGKKQTYQMNNYYQQLLGSSMTSFALIEAFTEEKENALHNPNTKSFEIRDIKRRRIDYFKKNGIDLGDEYEDYKRNEEAIRIWPSKDKVKAWEESKKEMIDKYNHDYYTNTKSFQRIKKKLEGYDFLDYTFPFNEQLFLTSPTFVSPNIIEKNGYHELIPIVVISFDDYDSDHKDHNIVHELNHLVELHLNYVSNDEYNYLSGWDDITEKLYVDNNDTYTEEKRKYELFNEIINERIAQDISKEMQEENIYAFDEPSNSTYENTTSYEYSNFLIDDFYEEFKEDILNSRRNGKIEIIYNAVGKENFEELNNLFEIYFEHFNGFKVYSLAYDLQAKKDTPSTRIYYDLVDKRDKILDKMRLHKAIQLENEKQITNSL